MAKLVEIRAWQALYTRVEAAAFVGKSRGIVQSSGYNFAFYSSAIADEAQDILRERIQCFQPKNQDAERYQFFTLTSGRVVISYSMRITPDKRINDQNERPGAFIAHCLILDPSDFMKVKNNAFAVIDAFMDRFVTAPEALINVANNPDKEEQVRFKVAVGEPNVKGYAQNWEDAELDKFILAGEQDLGGQTLALIGHGSAAEEVLRVAIAVSEPRYRLGMTFDTVVDSCQPPAGAFWAVGAASRIANAKFLSIDLAHPKMSGIAAGETNPKDLSVYGNWLRHSLKADPREGTVARAFTALQIAEALEAGQILVAAENAEAVDQFLEVNEVLIIKRFKDSLRKVLSHSMVESIYADTLQERQANRQTFTNEQIISAAATGEFPDVSALAGYVYAWITRTDSNKLAEDATQLTNLAVKGNHSTLGLVAALLKPIPIYAALQKVLPIKRSPTPVQEALAAFSPLDALPHVIHDLVRFDWAAPARFVTPKTASLLSNYFSQHPPQNESQWFDLVAALFKAGDTLAAFAPYVAKVSETVIKRLHKLLGKQIDKIAPEFKAALEARLDQKA